MQLPPLHVGESALEPKLTEAGIPYYSLHHLSKDPDVKATAFVEPGKFTIKVLQPVRGETISGQQYLRWSKPSSVTTTVKVNAKGLTSVNIFRTSGARLMNESANPNSLAILALYDLDGAYLALLHQQLELAGARLPIEREQALACAGDRGFIGLTHVYAQQKAYGAALAYLYPAYAEFSARYAAASRKPQQAFPDAFTPYLREPSWDRLVQKLFGRRLPPEVATSLQPEVLTMAQLAGAFLVRSLVPPQQLLAYPIHLTGGDKLRLAHYALPEVRKILRACDIETRQRLLAALQASSQQGYAKFVKALEPYLLSAHRSKREFKIKPISNVRNWEELREQVAHQYEPQLSANRYAKEARRRAPLGALAEAFDSPNDGLSIEHGRLSIAFATGKQQVLIDVDEDRVGFTEAFFAKPGLFPRGHPLRTWARGIRERGLLYKEGVTRPYRTLRFSFEDSAFQIQQLAEALDRLLLRHGIRRTAQNRSRTLVILLEIFGTDFGSEQSIERLDRNCWDLIGSTLPLSSVIEALIFKASVSEMQELEQVPAHTRRILAGY